MWPSKTREMSSARAATIKCLGEAHVAGEQDPEVAEPSNDLERSEADHPTEVGTGQEYITPHPGG